MSEHIELPPPLVHLAYHPLQWLKNKAVTLLYLILFIHAGTLIVTGLYYLVFELWSPLTHAWHNLITSNYNRHMVRDVGEGLLGGYLGQMIVWNHFKKRWIHKEDKPPNFIDKIEFKLRIPNAKSYQSLNAFQFGLSPVLGIIYAIPGFLIAILLTKWIGHHVTHVHHVVSATHSVYAESIWQKTEKIWTGNWDKKLVGLGSSIFLGRRPMRKVFDEVQLWFAEHRYILRKRPHWFDTPEFKARYESIRIRGLDMNKSESAAHRGPVAAIMSLSVLIGLGLAAFGWYVLAYIA